MSEFINTIGSHDRESLGQCLAENHGVVVVPGAFLSFGGEWIRFSYATPIERSEGAFKRLMEGLESLKK
jgi:aspartate/methionine/tyrosine aminotransferase